MTNEIKNRLNELLSDLPDLIVAGAVGTADYLYRHYSNEEWESYEQETGNKRPLILSAPKNALEAMIDEATGFKTANEENLAKFALWCVEGFLEGMQESKNITCKQTNAQ